MSPGKEMAFKQIILGEFNIHMQKIDLDLTLSPKSPNLMEGLIRIFKTLKSLGYNTLITLSFVQMSDRKVTRRFENTGPSWWFYTGSYVS